VQLFGIWGGALPPIATRLLLQLVGTLIFKEGKTS